jgi:hypothetical protein
MNKKGRGELESIVTTIFGIIIIGILFASGFVTDIFQAFNGFGIVGGILSILFILMICLAIWEALKRK